MGLCGIRLQKSLVCFYSTFRFLLYYFIGPFYPINLTSSTEEFECIDSLFPIGGSRFYRDCVKIDSMEFNRKIITELISDNRSWWNANDSSEDTRLFRDCSGITF